MAIELGIRLVIIFPTFLFLIGCCFRSIIQKTDFEKICDINQEIGEKMEFSFLIILSIDSIFLFIANGLILIFQFKSVEVGIIAIIMGVIFSICLIVCVFSDNGIIGAIGMLGIFGALGSELVYFSINDTMISTIHYLFEPIAIIIGIILGFFVGLIILILAEPKKRNDSEIRGQ